jgi:hypothetical protein
MITEADIRRVQEWMGHADIQTTMKYLHHAPREEDARLLPRLSKWLIPSTAEFTRRLRSAPRPPGRRHDVRSARRPKMSLRLPLRLRMLAAFWWRVQSSVPTPVPGPVLAIPRLWRFP